LMEKCFETESAGELKTHQTGTERILLVDDEAPVAGLERLGYRVKTFTDSLDVLAAFKARPHDFDPVITDMAMPKRVRAAPQRVSMVSRSQRRVMLICHIFLARGSVPLLSWTLTR